MKDNYFDDKDHVKIYYTARPKPPQQLWEVVESYLREKYSGELSLAVDVGCGSGQGMDILAPHFTNIIGCDPSEAQIEEANHHNKYQNVTFCVGSAEKLPLEDSSVQLVFSIAAVHFFDHETFYQEVDRVLMPGGVLVMACYHSFYPILEGKTEFLDKIIEEFRLEYLFNYRAPEHTFTFDAYRNIPMPPSLCDITYIPPGECGLYQDTPMDIDGLLQVMVSSTNFQTLKRSRGVEEASSVLSILENRLLDAVSPLPRNVNLVNRSRYYTWLVRKPASVTPTH